MTENARTDDPNDDGYGDDDDDTGMACMVCGDNGSGYHYSVYSCEGCKVRSVLINLRLIRLFYGMIHVALMFRYAKNPSVAYRVLCEL